MTNLTPRCAWLLLGNPARKISPIQVGTVFVGAAWVIGFAGIGTLIRPQLSSQSKVCTRRPRHPLRTPRTYSIIVRSGSWLFGLRGVGGVSECVLAVG